MGGAAADRLAAAGALGLLADGRRVVIVTAPVMDMVLAANWARWAALREVCRQQGVGLRFPPSPGLGISREHGGYNI